MDNDDFPPVSKIAKLIKNSEAGDRLSTLPEALLLHILSLVHMKEAVLSRRWQFLWTDLSELKFHHGDYEDDESHGFTDWVSTTLGICSSIHLKKFEVGFLYDDSFASSVNGWIQFLIKNKIKHVALDFYSDSNDCYQLPVMMYFNSSMTTLSLSCCTIAPPGGTIRWKSLTSLSLENFDLGTMGIILSGCPVLEYLELNLTICWGSTCLDLTNTPSLKTLVLTEDGFNPCLTQIIAPFIQHLSITGLKLMEGDQDSGFFRLTNVSSLVTANLDINFRNRIVHSEKYINDRKELLESLRHVEELEIGNWFIEVLSLLKMKGWQLPQFSCKCLTISRFKFQIDEDIIRDILCLLESSPNIETLILHWFPSPQKAPAALFDLNCDLSQLKIVKFEYDGRLPYPADDLMPRLVELLLRRARILEKMVIDVEDCTWSSSDRLKLAETVLSYPRSSPKAVFRLRFTDY